MHAILTDLSRFLISQSVHLALLFGMIWLLVLFFRKHSAHLRYLLWSVILVKCLVPPLLTVPLAMLPERAPLFEHSAPETTGPLDASSPILPISDAAINIEPAPFSAPVPAAQFPTNTVVSPPQEARATLSPLQWAAVAWATGLALLIGATVTRAVRFDLWLRRTRVSGDKCLQRPINDIVLRHWPRQRIRVYSLEGMSQPFVWGLVRGAMYLPANFNATGTDSTRRSVLLHEIAHVVRRDPLINLIQIAIQWIYWFHPLVWIANRMIRSEREKCCDEIAIARLNTSPKEYGSAIVDTLVNEYESRKAVPTLAIAGPVKNIEDRIKTIMKPGKRFYTRPTVKALILILLLAGLIAPTTVALTRKGQSPVSDSVTFPNGTRVDLVGLCKSPSEGNRWWRPDGSPLNDLSIITHDPNPPLGDDPTFAIVYRITGKYPVKIESIKGVNVKSALEVSQPQGLSAVRAHLQPGYAKTDIKIASPTGQWETVANIHGLGSTHNTIGWKKIILTVAKQDGEGLVASVSDEVGYGQATRVIAIDNNDQEYTGVTQSDLGVKGLRQRTVHFPGLRSSDLKTVAFQVCPYDHYTFKNIALQCTLPKVTDKAEQQTASQDTGPIAATGTVHTASLTNGATIELIGVRRYPSTESTLWTPDGKSLLDAPYDGRVSEATKVYEGRTWEMAARLVGTDRQFIKDAMIDWDIPSNTSVTVTSATKDGQPVKGTSAVVFSLPDDQPQHDISITATAGPWTTLSSIRANRKQTLEHYLKDGTKTIWSAPKDTKAAIPDTGNPPRIEDWSKIAGYTTKEEIQLRVVAMKHDGLMISGSRIEIRKERDRHTLSISLPQSLGRNQGVSIAVPPLRMGNI